MVTPFRRGYVPEDWYGFLSGLRTEGEGDDLSINKTPPSFGPRSFGVRVRVSPRRRSLL